MNPIDAAQRQLTALEALELRLLPEDGLVFDEPLPGPWLTETLRVGLPKDGLQFTVAGEGRVNLTVTPLGPVDDRPPVQIRGRIEARVETDCVRCLERVSPPVDAEIDLTLLAGPARPAGDDKAKSKAPRARLNEGDSKLEDWSGDAFPEPDALGEAQYEGDRIDLPNLIREGLLLALATDPTCEDEAGCDARTAALINAANRPVRAAEAEVDPRWAALKTLQVADDDPS